MKSRGLLTIALILVVAVAAVGWAWWTKYSAMDRAMAYYGTQHAQRIRLADEVELWSLGPLGSNENGATVDIDGTTWSRTGVDNASQWKGMVHARFYLVQDASYLWEGNIDVEPGSETWQYLLVFRDDSGETILALDFASERLKLLPHGESLSFHPSAEGLRIVLVRQ